MDKTVLCYIEKDNSYLMLYRNKKKNDLNEGKYIGIGGHIEDNESIEEALLREVKEETNLTLLSYKLRGIITFINDDYKEIMYLFTSDSFIGNLKDCNEGTLSWEKIKGITSLPIWEGDKEFLSLLENKEEYFELTLTYSCNKLVSTKRTK